MPDQFQEVSTRGWFARIGDSIKGLVLGGVLFLGAFPLLWWNEGRAVQTYESLQEGRGAVTSVSPGAVDAANEGRLVHLSGLATTRSRLTDPIFAVSESAIRLNRKAETYQWVEQRKSEKRKKLGGGEETVTTYTYTKEWREKAVDSGTFKDQAGHQNPATLLVESRSFQAGDVKVGAFELSDNLTSSIAGDVALSFPETSLEAISGELKGRVRISGAGLFIGRDPSSPAVGDVRVSFSKVPPGDVSIIARQQGAELGPYQTEAGDKIEMLRVGTATAEEMFEGAERANTMMTWVLRLVGFLVMAFGITQLLAPIRVLADVVPLLGTVVGMGLGLIAFGVAAPLSLLTIALAWIAHRPVLAVSLVLIACGIGGWLLARVMQKRRTTVTGATVGA